MKDNHFQNERIIYFNFFLIFQDFIMADYRCFNWPDCLESNGCTRFNDVEQLDVLREACLNDMDCIAVSCEDKAGNGECSRSMFSNTCSITTIDDEMKWTIYLLRSGNDQIFQKQKTTRTCCRDLSF